MGRDLFPVFVIFIYEVFARVQDGVFPLEGEPRLFRSRFAAACSDGFDLRLLHLLHHGAQVGIVDDDFSRRQLRLRAAVKEGNFRRRIAVGDGQGADLLGAADRFAARFDLQRIAQGVTEVVAVV